MVIDYYNPNTNEWVTYGEYITVAGESVIIEEVPYGKYRLREVTAPTGYILSDLNIEFEVSVDGAVIQLEFPNTMEIKGLVETGFVDLFTPVILLSVFTYICRRKLYSCIK